MQQLADRWALVTGASSGIGEEFARQLAARGMHLILTARREENLRRLAEDLHTRHGTRSEVIAVDLASPSGPADLCAEVERRGLRIHLLINNAGFGAVGTIEDADRERLLKMIQLNIAALTDLTYRVLPQMLERKAGGIINVASVAAFQPVAYMGVYSAGKAYVLHFSEALWAELRDRGVTVTALCPGTTRTEFFEIAGVGGWLKKQRSQSPAQVVKAGLRAFEKQRQYTVSGWFNYILSLLVRIAPRRTVVLESMKYFRPRRAKKQDSETEDATSDLLEQPPSDSGHGKEGAA